MACSSPWVWPRLWPSPTVGRAAPDRPGPSARPRVLDDVVRVRRLAPDLRPGQRRGLRARLSQRGGRAAIGLAGASGLHPPPAGLGRRPGLLRRAGGGGDRGLPVCAQRRAGRSAASGDLFAPALALGHAFGRLGCFLAGCCFGKASRAGWGVPFLAAVSPSTIWRVRRGPPRRGRDARASPDAALRSGRATSRFSPCSSSAAAAFPAPPRRDAARLPRPLRRPALRGRDVPRRRRPAFRVDLADAPVGRLASPAAWRSHPAFGRPGHEPGDAGRRAHRLAASARLVHRQPRLSSGRVSRPSSMSLLVHPIEAISMRTFWGIGCVTILAVGMTAGCGNVTATPGGSGGGTGGRPAPLELGAPVEQRAPPEPPARAAVPSWRPARSNPE